jgi:hypothetical protein
MAFGKAIRNVRQSAHPGGADKSWFVFLCLYGPEQPWFDKTWRPEEIEEMK